MKLRFIFSIVLFFLVGCSPSINSEPVPESSVSPGPDGSPGLSDNFRFQTTQPVEVRVEGVAGETYSLYDDRGHTLSEFSVDSDGKTTIFLSVALITKTLALESSKGVRLTSQIQDNVALFQTEPSTSQALTAQLLNQKSIEHNRPPTLTTNKSTVEAYDEFAFGHNYFPGRDQFGTLIFEDLWPFLGDYDFNDLVVDYNIRESVDFYGYIHQLQIQLRVVGTLASMNNGFGFQLGVDPTRVGSVTGGKYTRGYTELEANGTESRQEKAVIIAFEDAKAHHNPEDVSLSELITITINFTSGVHRNELGFPPYNPFLLSNGERGREIHLPGYYPTSLVNTPYFLTNDDTTDLDVGRSYIDVNSLPWAINLPETFYYPSDDIRVEEVYFNFIDWVDSEGQSSSDWYTNKPGYRFDPLIHRKKGTAGYVNCTDPFDKHVLMARYDSSEKSSILDENGLTPSSSDFSGYVSTWKDISGNEFHATAPDSEGAPFFCVDSGTSDLQKDSHVAGIVDDSLWADVPDVTSDFTFILVITPDYGTPQDFDSFFSNSTNPQLVGSWQVGVRASESACPGSDGEPRFATYLNDNGTNIPLCGGPYNNRRNVISISYNSSNNEMTFLRNGIKEGSHTWTSVPTFRMLKMFLNRAGSRHYDGKIHELILISSPVTLEENQDIGNYLNCKWQVEL